MVVVVEDFLADIDEWGELHLFDGIEDLVDERLDKRCFIADNGEGDEATLVSIEVSYFGDGYVEFMANAIGEASDDVSFAFEGSVTLEGDLELAETNDHEV